MEKNQVYLWYKDGILLDVFIIKDVIEWDNETVALLYGDDPSKRQGQYRGSFFSNMKLVNSLQELENPDEQKQVYELCTKYNVPLPGSVVRIDRFKGHGKYYTTLELNMAKYWDEGFVHDAVKKAIADQYPNLQIVDALNRTRDSYFLVCLKPFNKHSFPVVIWER